MTYIQNNNPFKKTKKKKDTTNKKISDKKRSVTYDDEGRKVVTKTKASVKGNPHEGDSVSKSKKL